MSPVQRFAIARVSAPIILCLALQLAGCTPYPLYNSGANPASRGKVASEEEADRVEEPSRDDAAPIPGGALDARLFRRAVDAYVGVPYKRGGSNLHGMDCSNLVSEVFRDYDGTELPASTRALYRSGVFVEPAELQLGDLVFFNFENSRLPAHVGIYLSNRRFVHASESTGVVISSIDDAPYRDAYDGARRVLTQTSASRD